MANIPSTPLHFPPNSNPHYNVLKTQPSIILLNRCKTLKSLKQIHAHVIKTGLYNTHFALFKLIQFCATNPNGDLSYALSIFDSIYQPNVLIWNTIIRGFSMNSDFSLMGIEYYLCMISSGVVPNCYTFPSVLKSCSILGGLNVGKQIHGHVLKHGFGLDLFIHTSLISMYVDLGELGYARQVFDKSPHRDVVSFTALISGYISRGHLDDARMLFDGIPVRDVVSWNAMIAGYAQSGRIEEALEFFKEMLRMKVRPNKSTMVSVLSACARSGSLELGKWVRSWIEDNGLETNVSLVSALIDMYSKCGDVDTARSLFEGLPRRDLVSWNVMIGGYTHRSMYKEALSLFRNMQKLNVEPNEVTFLAVLPACAHLGSLDYGKWIHTYVDRTFKNITNPSIWTSLIDMYAKCGDIDAAKQVFERLKTKTLPSWNALISGLAMHGCAIQALDLFTRMVNEGLRPDDITFVGVLSACNHAGLVDQGRRYFISMTQDYAISPNLYHYGCMIDLLGRAALFDEAISLINTMDIEPDGAIWGSLLTACRVHNKVEMAEKIAKQLFELEPNNAGGYILLSNTYARANRWDDVARIRTELNDRGMKKVPGCTSIEVDSVVHEFLVGDKVHPQSKEIYEMVDEVDRLLYLNGHVANTSEVLYDMDEERKEAALSHHSERLAIAYGLISTKPGTTIRIVKNLRVCENCHEATKLMSKIFNREIIARDRNRFHRFKDGSCSCLDYW